MLARARLGSLEHRVRGTRRTKEADRRTCTLRGARKKFGRIGPLGGLTEVLSIAKLAAGGQRYYLDQAQARVDHRESVASGVEDYYLAAPEAPGRWTGAEAQRLGLDGSVVVDGALHRARSWSDPLTGADPPGRSAQARVPGFDLMFSVPKSASVLFGICEADARRTIRRAQEEAVGQALRYLESVACRGRLGAGGQGEGFGRCVSMTYATRTER